MCPFIQSCAIIHEPAENDGLLHNLELYLILNDVVLLGVAFADCPGDEPFELGVNRGQVPFICLRG